VREITCPTRAGLAATGAEAGAGAAAGLCAKLSVLNPTQARAMLIFSFLVSELKNDECLNFRHSPALA